MTYDFHGSWDQNRAHHSSLNSKDDEKDDTMYIVCIEICNALTWGIISVCFRILR